MSRKKLTIKNQIAISGKAETSRASVSGLSISIKQKGNCDVARNSQIDQNFLGGGA